MASPIRIPDVANKVVAVLGLARSGLAAVEALHNSGAIVWAWDDAEKARANVPEPLLADLHQADWSKATALVMSPGIPTTFPKSKRSRPSCSENASTSPNTASARRTAPIAG